MQKDTQAGIQTLERYCCEAKVLTGKLHVKKQTLRTPNPRPTEGDVSVLAEYIEALNTLYAPKSKYQTCFHLFENIQNGHGLNNLSESR